MAGNKFDVFLSYCRKDMKFCDDVYQHLTSVCGFSVFLDREGIEGGSGWESEITDAITAAPVFLIILSEHSVKSENVQREIRLALNEKKIIIPIRIQNVELNSAARYQFATIQLVDVFEKTPEEQIKTIEKLVISKLGQKEAMINDDAKALRNGIEKINEKCHDKLAKMGTRISCQYENVNSIKTWLPFSIGIYGGSAYIRFDGKHIYAQIDLNGKHSTPIKESIYKFLGNAFMPPAAGTNEHRSNIQQKRNAYDTFHFFTYTINDTPISPKPLGECVSDLLRISSTLYERFIDAVGNWVAYANQFRTLLEDIDEKLMETFPESDGWIIQSKLSKYRGWSVYHKEAQPSEQWLGLLNPNESDAIIHIGISSKWPLFNWTYLTVRKTSALISLGITFEEDLLNTCVEQIGAGITTQEHIYFHELQQPFNQPQMTFDWQPEWTPWTDEQQGQFKELLIQKMLAIKPIYLEALKTLAGHSPIETAKAMLDMNEKTWHPTHVRYCVANLLQTELFRGLPGESWKITHESEQNKACINLRKNIGNIELFIECLLDHKGMIYRIGCSPDLKQMLEAIVTANAINGLSLTYANGAFQERIQAEDKTFIERDLTLQAWFDEFEKDLLQHLPKLIQLQQSIESHLLKAQALKAAIRNRVSTIFIENDGWILGDDSRISLSQYAGITIYKKSWTADPEYKVPILSINLEPQNHVLGSLFIGFVKGSGFDKIPKCLEKLLYKDFEENFADHPYNYEYKNLWIGCYLKPEVRDPGFIQGQNNFAERQDEVLEYISQLFLRLKKFTSMIDICAEEIKANDK